MTQSPWHRNDSPAIRQAKRSAAHTGFIAGLVIFGLLAVADVLLLVSDLRHGRDVTWILFSLFMLLVATGVVVSRRRRFLGGQDTDEPVGGHGLSERPNRRP